jgi:sulfotransferase family protein
MAQFLRATALAFEDRQATTVAAEQIRLKLDRFFLSFARAAPALDSAAVPPILVAAVGGSGTRVLVQVLRKAGWFMGNRVNSRNEDSLPIAWFLTKWLRSLKDFPDVDGRTLATARRDFERMLNVHRRGIPSSDAPWGRKNPRSMWLIPFLVDRFPKMKFVHMVRDARDMMLSEKLQIFQTQLLKLYFLTTLYVDVKEPAV